MGNDYHKYVISDGKFVGDFERMYEECADPWPESESDLDNNPVSSHTIRILRRRGFKRVFSVGLGKGRHAAWLLKHVPGVQIEGCEISQTAVDHCRRHYPAIVNHCLSVEQFIEREFEFDVVIFREVLWYILPIWKDVTAALARRYAGRHIILEVSCYDDQRYGTEYFDGPDDIVRQFPFTIEEIVRHHVTRAQREGMLSICGRM